MARSATSGLGWHIISLILVFISSILLFLVILLNIPLPFNSDPTVGAIQHHAWLLVIGPRSSKASGVTGPLEPLTGVPHLLSLRDAPGWHVGFGVWGMRFVLNRPFYHFPEDAPEDDLILTLDLPHSIRVSLSIASFFLFLALIGAVGRIFILLFALADPPYEIQPHGGTVPVIKPDGLSYGTYHSRVARNMCVGLISMVFLLAWTLPTPVVVGIGIQSVRDDDNDLQAWFGMGSALVVVAIVLLSLSYLFTMAGGTYVNTRLPVVSKPRK